MFVGVEDLGVLGVFVVPGVVDLGVLGVSSLGFPRKIALELLVKFYFYFLVDPCSLYSALIHLEINSRFN